MMKSCRNMPLTGIHCYYLSLIDPPHYEDFISSLSEVPVGIELQHTYSRDAEKGINIMDAHGHDGWTGFDGHLGDPINNISSCTMTILTLKKEW